MRTSLGTCTVLVALSWLGMACSDDSDPAGGVGGAGSGSGGGGSAVGGGSNSTSGSTGKSGAGNSQGGLPAEVPPRSPPGSCGLEKPAFCEDFEKVAPGGRGGDLDETLWAFSRWGHETREFFTRIPASQESESERAVTSVFCGKTFSGLLPPNDVVICDGVGVDGLTSGQLNEVYDDQGDFAFNSMRSRQLFDFTGRTGTVVFDVDAKINPFNLGHGWWIEFWITDDSAPMPYHEAPSVVSYPKNGLGINFQGLNDCPQGREATTVSRVFVTKDHRIVHDYPGSELDHESDEKRCITTADQKLNHFEIRVSVDKVEIWGSNHDDPKNAHRMATANILDLPFSRGYIHLQHSQYNAPKDGNVTAVQTYRWDNIGFDGPSYAPQRSFAALDNDEPDIDGEGGVMYGYKVNSKDETVVKIPGVELGDATRAVLDLNTLNYEQARTVEFKVNGGPPHTFEVPNFNRGGMRSFAVELVLSELKDGDNEIAFRMATAEGDNLEEYVGNIELTLENAK